MVGKNRLCRLGFAILYFLLFKTEAVLNKFMTTDMQVKYFEMYLNINTLEGFKYNYKYI